MKSIVISGYYGFDNFGDETVLKILTDFLKDENVTVISSNPTKTVLKYKVNSIKTFDFFKIISFIKSSDIFISGGGSLLQDVTSLRSLLYYIFLIKIALFFKKKVVIFAQGIGPLNREISKFLVKSTLKKCEVVTVRDEKSLFLLRGWGIAKTDLVCDPLFDLPCSHMGMERKKIGVQLRGFKTLSDNFLSEFAKHILKSFPNREIEIYSFQDDLDLKVCEKFENKLKNINPNTVCHVHKSMDYNELVSEFNQLEYMVAMRFHACIVALKCGVKTLAIAYDEKVQKLADEAGLPCLSLINPNDMDILFSMLKHLSSEKLYKFADGKKFNWSIFENIIK